MVLGFFSSHLRPSQGFWGFSSGMETNAGRPLRCQGFLSGILGILSAVATSLDGHQRDRLLRFALSGDSRDSRDSFAGIGGLRKEKPKVERRLADWRRPGRWLAGDRSASILISDAPTSEHNRDIPSRFVMEHDPGKLYFKKQNQRKPSQTSGKKSVTKKWLGRALEKNKALKT